MAQIILTNGAAAATPAAGTVSVYTKTSDKKLYFKDDAGVETGPLATAYASPLTTKGDLFTHSTVDTRLPVGVDGYALVADSTQAAGIKWAAVGGSGTVTSVSVVSANGLAGTVATPTTTPAITLSTSVTGVLKGNGTAISAATANTDYIAPDTNLTYDGTILAAKSNLNVGNVGTEGAGITVNGITYTGAFKSSDIGNTNVAHNIIHRHSTTTPAILVGARSNNNTTSHTDLTNGQDIFSIYGVGSAGTDYKIFGTVSVGADSTGTISGTSAPGRWTFSVTPDTSLTPVTALTITNDKKATFAGAISVAGHATIEGVTSTGATGTGKFVFDGSPTLVTPTIGVATATSINKMAITAPATSSTLAVADGKTLTASNTLTLAGTDSTTMTFPPASANIGYLEVPQNSQSAAYTCVLADSGKHLLHPSADTTARTFTIPANASVAYPIGTAITFVNQASAGTLTIAITTDTMRLAGAGTTGSRTLAANGIATALKITSTEWIISGTGLT